MSGSAVCACNKNGESQPPVRPDCISHLPFQARPILFRVEWPILVHIVPDVPAQVVGVVSHERYRFEDVEHLLLLPLLDALCRYAESKERENEISIEKRVHHHPVPVLITYPI